MQITNIDQIIPDKNIRLGEFLKHIESLGIKTQRSYGAWDGHTRIWIESSLDKTEYDCEGDKVRHVLFDFMSTKLNAKLNYIECEYLKKDIDTWIDGRIYKRSKLRGGSLL